MLRGLGLAILEGLSHLFVSLAVAIQDAVDAPARTNRQVIDVGEPFSP
jgi:hypothetical protein